MTLNAYIDEAGDEGFRFEAGSSRWFVLAAVIVDVTKDLTVARSINRIKDRLWPHDPHRGRQPLHWSKLGHAQKQVVSQELVPEDFVVIAVAFEKTSPRLDRERFDPRIVRARKPKLRSPLYFYEARFLVERICRFADERGTTVDFTFDNRSSLSLRELRTYITLLTIYPGPRRGKPTVLASTLGRFAVANKQTSKMLQVADACAGALFNALEPNRYGNIEDAYILRLANKFDRVSGKLWGYGLKLFPGGRSERVERYEQYQWMNKI